MGEKLNFCLLFICFQGGIEGGLKVVGGRESAGIGLRHDSSSEEAGGGWQRELEGEGCAQINVPCYKELAHCLRPDFVFDIYHVTVYYKELSVTVVRICNDHATWSLRTPSLVT